MSTKRSLLLERARNRWCRPWRGKVAGHNALWRLVGPQPLELVRRAALKARADGTVLAMYGRIPLISAERGGDRRVIDQLVGWDPDE